MRYAEEVNERVKMVIAVAVVAGVIGTLLTMSLFSTGIVRRVEALAANARLLERGEPLKPVAPARDELGQLASRMAQASELLSLRATEVQKAREEAERANQAKTEFLSRTSHELRTPLNAILGYAQLLERDLTAPDAPHSVALISKGGQHLLELINDVLDIARIETGRLDLSVQPVALADVIEQAHTLTSAAASARRIALSLRPSPAPLTVLADRRRLLQVLLNLLSNAVKYTQAGGSVIVSVALDAGQARISIADDGPGIKARELERLFMPFERLGATSNDVEGSGLGLAVCKQLMEAMKGQIGVESAAGSGSTFWIALPVAPAAAVTARAASVLYLHDGQSGEVLIEALLARRGNVGLHSATADTDLQALLATHSPDLVLLDVQQPAVVLQSWCGKAHMPPVAVLLGGGAGADTRMAGAAEVLSKPLEVPVFMAMMERLIP
jgi:signal transduction histidine kinase